jgi:hypothetical protein
MSVRSAVRDKVTALHEREQQILLVLLNWNIPATHSETVAAEDEGMTIPEASGTEHLASRVMQAIDASKSDFRTPQSLAEELGVSEDSVIDALGRLGDEVRRPIGAGEQYQDWYRSSSKPRTRGESWWLFRALAGHTGPGI